MPTDIAKIKEQLENMSSLGFSVYKPKYGTSKAAPAHNILKLLSWPPTGGALARRTLKHFNLGHDGKQQEVCPKTFSPNAQCVICNWVDAATRAEDPTMAKRATAIRQQERFMQIVIDINALEKDPTKKIVQIYDCPPKVHRNIMQTMASQDHDFTAWDSALVSLTCYDQGQGTPKAVDFSVALHNMAPKVISLDPAEWLPLCPPTAELFSTPPTPARLQALLDGRDPNETGEKGETAGAVEQATAPADEIPMQHAADPAPTTQQLATSAAQPVAPATTATGTPKMSLNDLIAKSKAGKK